jgi:hypothetical protein
MVQVAIHKSFDGIISASIQTRFDTAEFFAEFHVVRNDDCGFDVPFELGNSACAPLPFDHPKIQFADGDKRKRNRFPLYVGAVKISPGIARFVQVRENVRIEKKGFHLEDVLPSALVNCIDEFVDVLLDRPSTGELVWIGYRVHTLSFGQLRKRARGQEVLCS